MDAGAGKVLEDNLPVVSVVGISLPVSIVGGTKQQQKEIKRILRVVCLFMLVYTILFSAYHK